MANNKTSIIIEATDKTRQAVESAKAGLSSLQSSAAGVGAAMGGIGAALSVAGFASMVKGAIDAADALNDLSKKYGASVETLAGFNLAAEQSGTSMESIARGLNALSKEMASAPDKFASLGINTKNSTEALIQIADVFAALPDGAEKTALALELFGKSGADMIPMLNEGSAGMRKMIKDGAELSRVTTEAAKMADEFNDNLAVLKAASSGAGMAMTKELLGPLTEISKAMALAAREGGALEAVWVGLGGLGAALFTGEFDSTSKKITKLRGELGDLERHREDLHGGGYLQKWLYGSESEIDARIAATKKQIADLTASMNKPPAAPAQPSASADATKALRDACTLRGGKWVAGKCETGGSAARSAGKTSGPIDVFGNSSFITRDKDAAEFIRKQQEAINDLDRAMAQDGVKAAEEYQKRLDALVSDTPIVKTAQLMDNIALLDQAMMDGKISAEVHGQAIDQLTGKMADMSDSGKKDFEELQRAIEGWGKASAEAIVDFAFTGKMSVGDMVNSILKDLARMAVYKNVTSPMVDAFSGGDFMKTLGSFFGGGRASGGPVNPGQFYVVGENGPEILVPNSAGTVIPNGGGVAGGSTYHVAVSVDARGGQVTGDNAQASELGRRIEAAVRGVLLAEKRPGGMLAA